MKMIVVRCGWLEAVNNGSPVKSLLAFPATPSILFSWESQREGMSVRMVRKGEGREDGRKEEWKDGRREGRKEGRKKVRKEERKYGKTVSRE
jgi:hypothetical protein